ncbi:hypothetical protein [Acidovorax sp.]|uniref:hypothetical protein n=1 Tax=Acidovorax sp. TaxID=1872122 RepID=UPI0031DB7D08
MAAKKFLRLISGVLTEVFGVQSSAGAGNAGDIVALDDNGRIDNSMMPVGIGADTKAITTSEALAAGDWVNIWNSTGAKARKADATVAGKEADGFVLAAVSSGAVATVYFEGTNNQVSGQTPGAVFLQTTAGTGGATVPSASGNVVQRLGVAVSATEVNFERGAPVTLA